MKFPEFLEAIKKFEFEGEGEFPEVVNGKGVPINFIDVIEIPDPSAPAATEEQLSDPMYIGPQITVFMVDGYTDEELDDDESIREAPEEGAEHLGHS